MEPTIAPVADEPKKLLSAIELISKARKSYRLFSRKIQTLSLATIGIGLVFMVLFEGSVFGFIFWSQKSVVSLGSYFGLLFVLVLILFYVIAFFLVAVLFKGVSDLYESDYSGVVKTYSKIPKIFPAFLIVNFALLFIVSAGEYLLLIPAIAFAVYLFFTDFEFIVEGKRGFDALLGSWSLVKNRWWRVFGKFLLISLLIGVFVFTAEIIVGIVLVVIFSILSALNLGVLAAVISVVLVLAVIVLVVLYLYPLTLLIYFEFYFNLKETKQIISMEEDVKSQKSRKIVLSIFIALGILVLIIINIFANPANSLQKIISETQMNGVYASSPAAMAPQDLQSQAYISSLGQFQINLPAGWLVGQNNINPQPGINADFDFTAPQGQKSEISISRLDTTYIRSVLSTSTDQDIALRLEKSTLMVVNQGLKSEGLGNFVSSNLSQVAYGKDIGYVYQGSASSSSLSNTMNMNFKLITIFSGKDGYQILALWPESEYGSAGTALQDSLASFEVISVN